MGQEYNPLRFEKYKFDSLLNIVATAQRNRELIRIEFEILRNFYENNPHAFYHSLEDTQDGLKSKEELSDFEKLSIDEIEKILSAKEEISKLFYYREDLLMDSFHKLYRQVILNNEIEGIIEKPYIEFLLYTINTDQRVELVPIGEYYSDGTMNTGSRLEVKILKMSPKDFFSWYSAFNN